MRINICGSRVGLRSGRLLAGRLGCQPRVGPICHFLFVSFHFLLAGSQFDDGFREPCEVLRIDD